MRPKVVSVAGLLITHSSHFWGQLVPQYYTVFSFLFRMLRNTLIMAPTKSDAGTRVQALYLLQTKT